MLLAPWAPTGALPQAAAFLHVIRPPRATPDAPHEVCKRRGYIYMSGPLGLKFGEELKPQQLDAPKAPISVGLD